MKREVSTILRNARAMINDKDHWTQTVFARDEQGKPVDPGSDKACQWCATGAIMASAYLLMDIPRHFAENKARQLAEYLGIIVRERTYSVGAYNVGSIEDYNDELDHASVLAIFDEAIRRAEAKETYGWEKHA